MEVGIDSTFLPSNTEEAAIAMGCKWLLQARVVKSIIFPQIPQREGSPAFLGSKTHVRLQNTELKYICIAVTR